VTPTKAAIQLTQIWRQSRTPEQFYPVDCRVLADGLGLKIHGEAIDDSFEAMLRIRGKTRAIIYNENIREESRKNFCIAHELGHYSCHANQSEYFCTAENLNDIAPHPQNIEQEANHFAAQLLMPPDDFREKAAEGPLNLHHLSSMASQRYQTSLTATCKRFIELHSRTPVGMAFVKDGVVVGWDRTEEMRWTGFSFLRGHKVSIPDEQPDPHGHSVDSSVWLNEKNAARWLLTHSSIHMPYYGKTLYLVVAERNEAAEDDSLNS